MTGKRKRGDNFSPHEKLVHKSCSLLQREAKMVRTFLLRKLVQQLKQLRLQLEQPMEDAAKQQRLRYSVNKLEHEYAASKGLELHKVVARARLQTGLDKLQNEHKEVDKEDRESGVEDSNEDQFYMQGRDRKPKLNMEKDPVGAKQQAAGVKEMVKEDIKLQEKIIDRVLAHKRIVPVLDAIKKLVKKEEIENEKKRRAQEKRALKRGRHEKLVGNTGRSGVMPTSLFLGSLSGHGEAGADLDMGMNENGSMAGTDDDIAEFLGERKKRKNRPGQIARRMKAIRKEESCQRKKDRAKGIFVPNKINSGSASKYGPSERPKKTKLKAKSSKGDKQQPCGVDPRMPTSQTQEHAARAPNASVEAAHPSWLAKQKQKEKEKVSLTAFSGKKIIFG